MVNKFIRVIRSNLKVERYRNIIRFLAETASVISKDPPCIDDNV